MVRNYLLCLVILSNSICADAQSDQNVKDLVQKLLVTDGYKKSVRPSKNQTELTLVTLNFNLIGIIDFDQESETLTTSGYVEIHWSDNSLKWAPSDFGGLREITIPQDDIWKPDVALQNGYSSFSGLGSSFLYARVSSNGDVTWRPFEILQSTCAMKITYFPFDTQVCVMKLVSWSYNIVEVFLESGSKGIITSKYTANSAWDLVATNSFVEQDTDEVAVFFQLKLARKSLFYIVTIIVPIIFLSILNIFVFMLPVESGERAGFSITVFLSLAVFLTIVSSLLPKNSDSISFISVYLLIMASFSTVIVFITICELRLQNRDCSTHPVPAWLVHLHMFISKPMCVKERRVTPTDSDSETKEKLDEHMTTWTDIVGTLDFIFFWIFTIATAVITSTIFLLNALNSK